MQLGQRGEGVEQMDGRDPGELAEGWAVPRLVVLLDKLFQGRRRRLRTEKACVHGAFTLLPPPCHDPSAGVVLS